MQPMAGENDDENDDYDEYDAGEFQCAKFTLYFINQLID